MIYVFLASGFEEIEALASVDVLRRAELDVVTVGVGGKKITGSHAITVECDLTEDQIIADENIEMIVLPGGMPGTLNLEKSAVVHQFIDYCTAHHKWIGAICAAPSILGHKNLLNAKKATCFPGFEDQLFGADVSEDFICVDDHIITGKGMGVATEFGLALLCALKGEKRSEILRASLQCRD